MIPTNGGSTASAPIRFASAPRSVRSNRRIPVPFQSSASSNLPARRSAAQCATGPRPPSTLDRPVRRGRSRRGFRSRDAYSRGPSADRMGRRASYRDGGSSDGKMCAHGRRPRSSRLGPARETLWHDRSTRRSIPAVCHVNGVGGTAQGTHCGGGGVGMRRRD